FILIEHPQGVTNIDGYIFKVLKVLSANEIEIVSYDATVNVPTGVYTGGGVISRISRIDIKTKQYNFYGEGIQLGISKVDFDVNRTTAGKIAVGFFASSSEEEMGADAISTGAALGHYILDTFAYSTLYPMESSQSRVVHPVYIQAQGDCIQLQLWMSDEFMFDKNIQLTSFKLNSMTFWASPTQQRL
ncbi:MAG: hypothetical protein ACOC80_15155, partial [Petrotogales bacterium]